jgi:NAD(P)-dependent dehydrogenase (short-subunit alcohol dehydrogenase family)
VGVGADGEPSLHAECCRVVKVRDPRQNSICPVAVSPYTEARGSAQPGAIDRPISMNPLRRIGDAETDIGRSVVYVASGAGRHGTGTTLMVDGGFRYVR